MKGSSSPIIARGDSGEVVRTLVTCGQVYEFDPQRVRPFPDQIRKRFTGIKRLALSIRFVGQTNPGKVRLVHDDPQYDAELIDGERRLRAVLLIPDRRFKAFVEDGIEDVATQYEHCVASNFGRQDHDPLEITASISRFQQDGKKNAEIAQIFGKSEGWVSQYLSLAKLAPEVQAMLTPPDEDEDERGVSDVDANEKNQLQIFRPTLPFSVALLLVRLAHDVQVDVAKKIMSDGMSASAARRLVLNQLRESPGGDKRRLRPTEQWQSLERLARQTKDRFGVFLDLGSKDFLQVVKASGAGNRGALEEGLRALVADLTELADSISKIKDD